MRTIFITAKFPQEVEKASVSFWYVKEGDKIMKDQDLIEFVTEKTSFTYPSPFSCKIIRLLVREGDDIRDGQTIAEAETE